MQQSLSPKNKLSFVDGSIQVPKIFYLNKIVWKRCNSLVHSWILNFVTEHIPQTIMFLENSLDVWIDLKEFFLKYVAFVFPIGVMRSTILNNALLYYLSNHYIVSLTCRVLYSIISLSFVDFGNNLTHTNQFLFVHAFISVDMNLYVLHKNSTLKVKSFHC